mgnify:CR=1 FL=1
MSESTAPVAEGKGVYYQTESINTALYLVMSGRRLVKARVRIGRRVEFVFEGAAESRALADKFLYNDEDPKMPMKEMLAKQAWLRGIIRTTLEETAGGAA